MLNYNFVLSLGQGRYYIIVLSVTALGSSPLDALALSVIAIRRRGCLGGWLSVCHSRYCIKTT